MGIMVDYIMQNPCEREEALYDPLKASAGVWCKASGTGGLGRWKRFDKLWLQQSGAGALWRCKLQATWVAHPPWLDSSL